MLKEKNPIIVATMCIFRMVPACWQEEAFVYLLIFWKAVRQSIYDNIDEYIAIVEDPEFKKYFPVIGEDFLKTAPKGFPERF